MSALKLIQFPKPEQAVYPIDIGSGYSYNREVRYLTTPYESLSVEGIIKERGIRLPFAKIVEKADGISVCPHCKTRYAGHQQLCTNKIEWYKAHDDWDWVRNRANSRNRMNVDIKISGCGTSTDWNLQEEFNAQKSFFDFVSFLGTIGSESISPLHKYREALPPGSSDEYRTMYLEQTVMKQGMRIERLEEFVKAMSEKMNSAGHNLIW